MVVLESMALGIPVVSTRVEGVPEVITDGLNGLLADPGDVTSFAGCLQRLTLDSSLAKEIGVAGHRRQRASFSDRSMAEGVARVYDQLLFGDSSRQASSDV